MPTLRSRILAGETLVATFVEIPDPVSVEICAASGVDAVCMDWEHAQISRGQIENLIRAADVHRVPALVRVPGSQPEWIAAALDAGAAGVIVPRVESAAQAEGVSRSSRYPPLGARGLGPGRASGYGYSMDRYVETANESILLAVQVETAEGFANVAAITAVGGVDLIFIGPGDLASSLDARGPEGTSILEGAIGQIIATAAGAGRKVGIFRGDPEDIGRWVARGITLFIVGADALFMGTALKAAVAKSRAAINAKPSGGAVCADRQD